MLYDYEKPRSKKLRINWNSLSLLLLMMMLIGLTLSGTKKEVDDRKQSLKEHTSVPECLANC